MSYKFEAKTDGMEVLCSSHVFVTVDREISLSVKGEDDEFTLKIVFSSSKQGTDVEQVIDGASLTLTFSANVNGSYISKGRPSIVATMNDGTELRFAMYTRKVNSQQMLMFYSFLKDSH